ncbi:Cysteine synthase 2 [Hirsutella minnesotensis 3608]|nr:Cysteine synthase 2 [Hirsutella minnesotensis 3608]
MSLSQHPKAYSSAAAVAAFAAGVLVTLGVKDLYPDLEKRYQRKFSTGGRSMRRQSSFFWAAAPLALEDHESEDASDAGDEDASPADGIEACIGNTPLIEIRSLSEATGRVILAKAEFLNGAGNSPKDRVALNMIVEAEREGLLVPHRGDTIYEGTVGSTGISLATLARARGYRAHICMPDDQSLEKSEIYAQTKGTLDAFVAGAGTGGTISGVARHLKVEAKMARLRVVLADPQGSGLYNKVKHGVMYSPTEREGTRRRQQVDSIVEGIGINRVTDNFEAGRDLIDDAVKVSDDQACRMARWLVEHDGIFIGSSSAVNCVAAVATAMSLPAGSRVVTVLCDSGTRHVSKFWKQIKEMGLEEGEASDLLSELGLSKTGKQVPK